MQLRRSEMLLGVSALPSDCTRCDLRAPSVSRQLVSFGQAATTYTSCKCGNAFHDSGCETSGCETFGRTKAAPHDASSEKTRVTSKLLKISLPQSFGLGHHLSRAWLDTSWTRLYS